VVVLAADRAAMAWPAAFFFRAADAPTAKAGGGPQLALPRRRNTARKLRVGELRACSTEHQLAAQMLDQSPQLGDFGRARLSLSRASSVGARRRDCLRSRVAPSRRSASARSSPNVVRYTRHTRFGLSVCGSTMSIIAAPLAMLS